MRPRKKPARSPLVAAGTVFGNKRESKRLSRTEPKHRHRQAVLEVSNVLSNLALPAISKVALATALPPGRMRSREAVRQSAERAQGRMTTAKPWKGTKRRHSVGPPADRRDRHRHVRLHEVGRAGGRRIRLRLRQRRSPDRGQDGGGHVRGPGVPDRPARSGHVERRRQDRPNDGTEACDYALAALDGVLHLTDPSYAARILVVVSDGCLVKHGRGGQGDSVVGGNGPGGNLRPVGRLPRRTSGGYWLADWRTS